ncbi:MAG: molecular chaperone [Hydrogenophaga sp.]|nr:molecular chaperone [Hydrogenophaga sp.]MDP3133129.1 fimbria/pilus periplasmic chaperone [Burkholderiaceae bacterium]
MHTSQKMFSVLALAVATWLAAWPVAATAGVFSVSPVRMFMAPKDRAIAVTINNEGDEELVMQADVFLWKQKPGGEDELVLTEDMILSPPIVKLAPRSRQVVRLAMLRPRPTSEQLTYRLVVREVPEARPVEQKVQLQLALAFSLPVFITPPGAKPQLGCTVERVAMDTVRAQCENTGNAYAQPRELTLLSASGEKLALRDSGGYILPSIKRSFDLKRAEGRIPGGNARLAVALDDGSTQSFDVSIPE